MSSTSTPPTDLIEAPHDARSRAVELMISNVLRVGVIASLVIVVLGTVVSFVHHPEYSSEAPALERLTTPGTKFPHSLRDVMHGLADGRGQSIIIVGLLLLIATPVVRVAFSILAFAYEGDRRYVIITTIVLLLLVLSFVLGKAEG